MQKQYVVAIVGASGAVGLELLKLLDSEKFPISKLVLLASSKSAGKKLKFKGKDIEVKETTESIFEKEGIEIAFFSAGGSVSEKYAPHAAKAGALVIDNTSFFRMNPDVPLVVPEVNPQDIFEYKSRIIANPNCSTIQMVHVLNPLHKAFGIRRVDVSTYQAVSGAGLKGMEELVNQTKEYLEGKTKPTPKAFKHQIAFNLIPHIDVFLDNSYTKEEMKMVNETKKIMHADFDVSATCVRVPVIRSHSESITIKFDNVVDADDAREALSKAENVVVIDEIAKDIYPMPTISTDTDFTYVGRIRQDISDKSIIHLFCVADQLRVGAATNALRIAQKYIAKN
ncbi:aspartate-semialdehyde dehydrogenase [Helicobacter sp. 11S02629-2]|uniref:aspartate-semialdehyde dehydrogenase n=1 Tax=Helicobacter sp. 11S02629-2 TaxID=1476195 RepID=UPI000BA605EF|nr:aspartate-semialdehyde dehydrogenase [Helicobacter sp. 11S02629-2]PAF43693.1 aspartate-semialdehyde dehydrogenase [Helicobacter sp. 11S02629-2]